MVVADVHRLQKIEQGRPLIPRRTVGLLHHIIAIQCRQRDAHHIGYSQRLNETPVFCHNLIETFFRKVHQIHLVHSQHHVLNAQQRYQKRVTAGLRDNSQTGINQNHSQIGRRTARNHIACVLLVSRCVGNDKLTLVGREIAISHINGDALLALGFQSVQQKGIINMITGITHALAVAFQRIQLVLVYLLAIEQEAAD